MTHPAATLTPKPRPLVTVVVQQHVEGAALLRHVRSVLVRAPDVGLDRLALFDRLLSLLPEVPEARRGLVSVLGWVPARALRGLLREFLAASSGLALELGIKACRLQRVDPGRVLGKALDRPVPALQTPARRCVRVLAWRAREQPGLEAVATGDRLCLGRPMSAQASRHALRVGGRRQRVHAAWQQRLLAPLQG